MPKTQGTRKQKAAQLLELVNRGPSFTSLQPGIGNPDELNISQANGRAKQDYILWVDSWILPLLIKLVPELKGVDLDALMRGDDGYPLPPEPPPPGPGY